MHNTTLVFVLVIIFWNSESSELPKAKVRGDDQLDNLKHNRSITAKGRVFAITVPQEPCKSSGTALTSDAGVCYPKKLCQKKGGTIINTASDVCGPVGSCCLFTFKPTSNSRAIIVNEKISTIVPNKDFSSNRFTFPKMPGYCQLKVEFVEFTYQHTPPQPSDPTEGQVNGLSSCNMESLTFSGSVTVSQRFVICGNVPPERPFYLSYGSTGENIKLNFVSNRTPRNTFKLRVTQVSCDSDERVDDHCLLQYNEGSGQVESFGYGSYQIQPQEYSVCIGNPSNNNIQWRMCTSPPSGTSVVSNFFLTSYFGPGLGPSDPARLFSGFDDSTCEKTSYVSIGQNGKYCGAYFPPTTGGPSNMLHIRFRADDLAEFTTVGAAPSLTKIQPPATTCVYTPSSTTVPDPKQPIFHTCSAITGSDQCYCNAVPDATGVTNRPARRDPTGFCLQYD